MSEHEIHRLVNELRLQQIELDLQNEKLRCAQEELEAAWNRCTDLYDFTPVGYVSLDASGVILEANLTATQLLGVPKSRLLQCQFSDFVAAGTEAPHAVHRHRQQVFGEATPCTCNLWMQRQDGTPFYAQIKSLVQRDGERGPLLWRLALIDLTALCKKTEELLAWNAAIVDNSRDAIIGKTLDGTIISWNAAAECLYGYRAAEVIGRPIELLAPTERRHEPSSLLTAIQCGERVENYETQRLTKDGTRLDVSLTLSPIQTRGGAVIGVSVIARNITRRKQREAQLRCTEQALRQSQTQLRHLAWRQQQLQEQERRHIAQEIHDELAQSLTILRLDLAWLTERPEMTHETCERLRAMITQVDEVDKIMHRIAMELRPPLLDDLGLLATLEWQIEEIHRHTGLAYTLQLPSESPPLDIDRATVLFRIFQEALTNVVRHADASRVYVRVTWDAEAVCLAVKDNGKGITAMPQALQNGFGILGMRERAGLWGGEVCITGHAGSGTTVTVRMPYGAGVAPEGVP